MTTDDDRTTETAAARYRLHRVVLVAIQIAMALELAALAWRGYWLNATIVLGVMALTLAPGLLRERLPVRVPYVFQFLVVLFVFASLFLGEVRRFYDLFWWWDMVLHFGSGLLLGIFGFMLIYILNEDERAHLSVRPGFMALFAFCFGLALGALWEIFEFSMDQIFGTNMQKPMLGDPSGLTDTMWDLIVDGLGAAIVALYGWYWMRRGERSFLTRWIDRVTVENPHLFRGDRVRHLVDWRRTRRG